MTLRDGDPGEPEVMFSPLRYHYQHRAEIEAVLIPVVLAYSKDDPLSESASNLTKNMHSSRDQVQASAFAL
jgi:hypothetical protein